MFDNESVMVGGFGAPDARLAAADAFAAGIEASLSPPMQRLLAAVGDVVAQSPVELPGAIGEGRLSVTVAERPSASTWVGLLMTTRD